MNFNYYLDCEIYEESYEEFQKFLEEVNSNVED
jgi:hypothetical protein